MIPTKDLSTACILFELGGTRYAVKSSEVQHLEMVDHITPVPNAPPFVDGIVFSRGRVVPVVNLRKRFGLPPEANTLRTRLIVVKVGGREVGMIVDAAKEFRAIPAESIQPPHNALELSGKFLSGIATVQERLVLMLDLETTLNIGTSELFESQSKQAVA
ncbi:MAG: chemotaxis protein CheW [Limisphaerales bacterium]